MIAVYAQYKNLNSESCTVLRNKSILQISYKSRMEISSKHVFANSKRTPANSVSWSLFRACALIVSTFWEWWKPQNATPESLTIFLMVNVMCVTVSIEVRMWKSHITVQKSLCSQLIMIFRATSVTGSVIALVLKEIGPFHALTNIILSNKTPNKPGGLCKRIPSRFPSDYVCNAILLSYFTTLHLPHKPLCKRLHIFFSQAWFSGLLDHVTSSEKNHDFIENADKRTVALTNGNFSKPWPSSVTVQIEGKNWQNRPVATCVLSTVYCFCSSVRILAELNNDISLPVIPWATAKGFISLRLYTS